MGSRWKTVEQQIRSLFKRFSKRIREETFLLLVFDLFRLLDRFQPVDRRPRRRPQKRHDESVNTTRPVRLDDRNSIVLFSSLNFFFT
jgi:hypothetical protein